MKRMIMAILLVAAATQIASAQKPSAPEKGNHKQKREAVEHKGPHGNPVQHIGRELGLTEEQSAAFAPVYEEYRKAVFSAVSAPKHSSAQREAEDAVALERLNASLDSAIKVAEIRKEYVAKFNAVITPQQIAKLYRMEESFKYRNDAGKGPQGAPHHGPQGGHGGNGKRPPMPPRK